MGQSISPEKQCPYCGKVCDTRGLHLHVLKTTDDDHGAFNDIPNNFNSDNIKTVNKRPNAKISKSSSTTMDKHLYLCNWCNELCKGERGYKIHLSKMKGDGLHPNDASIKDEEYTLVPCDDEWNSLMDIKDVYKIQKRRRDRKNILKDR